MQPDADSQGKRISDSQADINCAPRIVGAGQKGQEENGTAMPMASARLAARGMGKLVPKGGIEPLFAASALF
jgi:hypothetical protein